MRSTVRELYLSCLHLVSLLVKGSGDEERGPEACCNGCGAAQRMLPQRRGYQHCLARCCISRSSLCCLLHCSCCGSGKAQTQGVKW